MSIKIQSILIMFPAHIDQIKNQDYAGKYRASDKVITGIGAHFNSDKKGIDDWMGEVL